MVAIFFIKRIKYVSNACSTNYNRVVLEAILQKIRHLTKKVPNKKNEETI